MIWGSSKPDPRFMSEHAKRPWAETEPLEKVHTCDPKEKIDVCLRCTLKTCKDGSPACLLNGLNGKQRRTKGENRELDKQVKKMIYDGWRSEAIIQELDITKNEYYECRRRLRSRGELKDCKKDNGWLKRWTKNMKRLIG